MLQTSLWHKIRQTFALSEHTARPPPPRPQPPPYFNEVWVNCPFGLGEKVQNRFSTWLLGGPSWILYFRSEWFELFLIYSHPDTSYQTSQWASIPLKFKIDFQDDNCSHLVFPIGAILAISDLQVTLMSPTKFQVNWPFGSGVEAKNRFLRWPPFPIGTSLAFIDLQVNPMLSTKFWVNWPFGSGEEAKNRFSRWVILNFRSERY